MGRLIGDRRSVPVAANYPSHPITERFNCHDGVSAGAVGHAGRAAASTATPRRPSSRPAREAGPKRTSRACWPAARSSLDEAKGDKKGPVAIAAAVSARPSPASRQSPTTSRRAEAGDPRRRHRRLGLRGQRRASGIQGNRDLFMNIGRLAVAAGEPDLDPRRRKPRTAAITLTATQQSEHHLAVAAHHSRRVSSAPASTPGGGGDSNARPAIHDRAAGCPGRPRRVHLFRHLEDAGTAMPRTKQEKVFAAVEPTRSTKSR